MVRKLEVQDQESYHLELVGLEYILGRPTFPEYRNYLLMLEIDEELASGCISRLLAATNFAYVFTCAPSK